MACFVTAAAADRISHGTGQGQEHDTETRGVGKETLEIAPPPDNQSENGNHSDDDENEVLNDLVAHEKTPQTDNPIKRRPTGESPSAALRFSPNDKALRMRRYSCSVDLRDSDCCSCAVVSDCSFVCRLTSTLQSTQKPGDAKH